MSKQYLMGLSFLTLLLSGCGGGSGSSGSDNSSNSVFTISENSVEFSHVIGVEELPDPVDVFGDISNASGDIFVEIQLTDSGVVDAERTRVFGNQLSIVPGDSASLGPGIHNDTITVRACRDSACNNQISGSPKTINVEYSVSLPEFSILETLPVFDGGLGDSLEPAEFFINTIQEVRSNQIIFTNDIKDDLFVFEAGNGMISFEGYRARFNVSLNSTEGLAPGTYNGTITATYNIEGYNLSETVPFELVVSGSVLRPQRFGVAFTKTNEHSKLTDRIKIESRNSDSTVSWHASTNTPWLTITPDGTIDTPLEINADPTNLAQNTLHQGTISVSEAGSNNSTQVIHVGFWVGSEENQINNIIPGEFSNVLADNIRPYMYVAEQVDVNLVNIPNNIKVYNIYTGELIETITGIDSKISDMQMSSDGQFLYVMHGYDHLDENGFITKVDLNSYALENTWTSELPLIWFQEILRPHLEDIIVTTKGQAFRASNGQPLAGGENVVFSTVAYHLGINSAATEYCQASSGSPVSLTCGDAYFSDFGNNISLQQKGSLSRDNFQGGSGTEVVLNNDGIAYFAKSRELVIVNVNEVQIVDIFEISGTGEGVGIELGSDGSVFGVSTSSVSSSHKMEGELFRYTETKGMQRIDLGTLDLIRGAQAIGLQYQVSADNLISIVPTDENAIVLIANPE